MFLQSFPAKIEKYFLLSLFPSFFDFFANEPFGFHFVSFFYVLLTKLLVESFFPDGLLHKYSLERPVFSAYIHFLFVFGGGKQYPSNTL